MRTIDADEAKKIAQIYLTNPYEIISSCAVIDKTPTLIQQNEPLTLEELKALNEYPIWIQNLEEPDKSQWRLLYWDRGKYLVLQGISTRGYLIEEYGKSWLAYRRPPNGADTT